MENHAAYGGSECATRTARCRWLPFSTSLIRSVMDNRPVHRRKHRARGQPPQAAVRQLPTLRLTRCLWTMRFAHRPPTADFDHSPLAQSNFASLENTPTPQRSQDRDQRQDLHVMLRGACNEKEFLVHAQKKMPTSAATRVGWVLRAGRKTAVDGFYARPDAQSKSF